MDESDNEIPERRARQDVGRIMPLRLNACPGCAASHQKVAALEGAPQPGLDLDGVEVPVRQARAGKRSGGVAGREALMAVAIGPAAARSNL